jgi:hypothetical protein
MAFDSKRVADRLKEKVKSEKGEGTAAEEKSDAGTEEPSDTSPGRMALRAIKAGDAEALEEAIRACVEKAY